MGFEKLFKPQQSKQTCKVVSDSKLSSYFVCNFTLDILVLHLNFKLDLVKNKRTISDLGLNFEAILTDLFLKSNKS